jgi:hypothetical protein
MMLNLESNGSVAAAPGTGTENQTVGYPVTKMLGLRTDYSPTPPSAYSETPYPFSMRTFLVQPHSYFWPETNHKFPITFLSQRPQ